MINFDPNLEIRVLKTVLETRNAGLITSLNQEYFGFPVAKEIWNRISSLRQNGKPMPSSLTLSGDTVLSENAQTVLRGDVPPFNENEIPLIIEQLNLYRQGRVIFDMNQKVLDLMKESSPDISQARFQIEKCLLGLQNSKTEDEVLTYGYDNDLTLDRYENMMSKNMNDLYVPTGFYSIDSQQGGLGRGKLYAIGAKSGGGKSTLANQICINAYLHGFSSNYNSFEMGWEECMIRTQAAISRIPASRFNLKNYTEVDKVESDRKLAEFLAHGEASGKRLQYNCPGGRKLNLAQLFAEIEHLKFDLVVIDYINLLEYLNPKESMWWNLGESFRLAKQFAERTKSVVIMLVQIDEDTGKIKYAQSIKHHSDGVWIWDWNEQAEETGIVEVEQIKLRNFKPTKFNLRAEFEYCSFTDTSGPGRATTRPNGAVVAPPKPMEFS